MAAGAAPALRTLLVMLVFEQHVCLLNILGSE